MPAGRVRKISDVAFDTSDEPWFFARDNASAIEQNWQRATAQNPKFFNGTIFLMSAFGITDTTARAKFLRTNFKSYLFWRECGWPEADVLDGFGSALVRASDGGILLARQNAGHVNAGLVYLPGGFIDERDAGPDGRIDIDRSVDRELLEETGLGPDVVTRSPGYYVTESRPQMSFAVCYQANIAAEDLKRRVEAFIATSHDGELGEIIVARGPADIEQLDMAPFARQLLSAVFEGL